VHPFGAYYADPIVRAILVSAVAVDLLLLALFGGLVRRWYSEQSVNQQLQRLYVVALVAALLPVFEIARASTFYYGEIGDKQDLWLSANHFGLLGTALLFTIAGLELLRQRDASET
jgi:hypothetical protein